eukprot:5710092-Lingulodinium_polyedra.AAC.1
MPRHRARWAGPPQGTRERPPPRRPHLLVGGWGRLSCGRCGRWAEAPLRRRRFRAEECSGPPRGLRGLAFRGSQAVLHGHALAATGAYLWCTRCGAWAVRRPDNLTT